MDAAGINAWSDVVGDPYCFNCNFSADLINGWFLSIPEGFNRNDRGVTSHITFPLIIPSTSSSEYASVTRTSTVNLHSAGTWLCACPALITVTDILTFPNVDEILGNEYVRNQSISSNA